MKFTRYLLAVPLASALIALAGAGKAEAIVVTFDAGVGFPLSYTESGLTVISLFPASAGHLHMGDTNLDGSPDLYNHGSGCCSSPYEFTYSGGVFTLVSVMLHPFFGVPSDPTTITSSLGVSVLLPGVAVPTLTFFPAGFSGTSFLWDAEDPDFFGDAIIDDLTFTPGGAAIPEPGTMLLLGSGLTGLALRRRRRNR